MKIIKITKKNISTWQEQIENLESLSRYPLGKDFFRIDHGDNYLSFFARLGKTHYYAAVENGKIIAVAAGILRTIKQAHTSSKVFRVWYLCALQVHPSHRGRKIPLRIFSRAFFWNYLKCQKIYAISMDGAESGKVERLLKRFRWAPMKVAATLNFFSLSFVQLMQVRDLIERHLGNISFLSLAKKKDLILESTSKPLPLLHIQHGSRSHTEENPKQNHVHMMCLPASHVLCDELVSLGLLVSATATIIHRGMSQTQWDFVMTSDI